MHIVWTEHWCDYRRSIIPTDFCDVLICISPLEPFPANFSASRDGLFRVSVEISSSFAIKTPIGPLSTDLCIVRGMGALAALVLRTAVNASCVKRAIDGTTHQVHRRDTLNAACQQIPQCTAFADVVERLFAK